MNWMKVLDAAALPEGARKVVQIKDHTILLIHEAGTIYAVSNQCPHMRLPLKRGKVEDATLTCPFHRSEFDLNTGDVKAWSTWPPVAGRLLGTISQEKALPVFETKIEDGAVWIALEGD
jgi:nitrite reductase/ring-hydroxylating ferredoxin subunit